MHRSNDTGDGGIWLRKKKLWMEIKKGGNFKSIGEMFHIDPVIARLIRNKDIVGDKAIQEYLMGGYEYLHDPYKMKDIKEAALIIKDKIAQGNRICIVGDYDADGVNSTYIMKHGLENCGADVIFRIPDRILDGYGINKEIVDEAREKDVDTLLTCDNGISAIEAINYAKELGMTVIVTDHHQIPYEVCDGEKVYLRSKADAIINPHQEDCAYPYEELCGAAVSWKFIQVLYNEMGKKMTEADEFLENVGIATICDVMDLTGENRIIVKLALLKIKRTTNKGLLALIDRCGLTPENVSTYHIGFVIGPCINATGRLDTAVTSLKLLDAKTEADATFLADELATVNETRKEMTKEGTQRALEIIESSEMKDDRVLVVYLKDCHESIAGIIAGRIREAYYRPVIVMTESNGAAKGSGRSIEEYSMYDELVKCKELLLKFGGHPMAAGLSLELDSVDTFRNELNTSCTLTEKDLTEKTRVDAILPMSYVTKELIYQLDYMEPCGKGNTKPVFAECNIKITELKVFGKNNNVLKFKIETKDGFRTTAVYFGEATEFLEYIEEKFGVMEKDALLQGHAQHTVMNVIYYPKINDYMGRENVEFVIKDFV